MPINWSEVIPKSSTTFFIHLGDFNLIKENFGVIGKLVTGSGFEGVCCFFKLVCAPLGA